jgi:acetyl-CoA carboxylase beta subunit
MEVLVFLLAVVAFAFVGVRIGMLVAPRLTRAMDRSDEDDGDGTA